MDIARWMIPGATLPKSVVSLGGRFGYTDQGETPNSMISLMDFGGAQLIFEVRGLDTDDYMGQKIGNIVHLEEGTIAGNKFYANGKEKSAGEPLPKVDAGAGPAKTDTSATSSPPSAATRPPTSTPTSSKATTPAPCHLANISYRLGEKVPFNTQTKAFGDCKDAYETLERMEEYLTKKNGLKLDGLEYGLGRKLTVDAKSESFVDAPDANKLLTRQYRKPFVVPESLS